MRRPTTVTQDTAIPTSDRDGRRPPRGGNARKSNKRFTSDPFLISASVHRNRVSLVRSADETSIAVSPPRHTSLAKDEYNHATLIWSRVSTDSKASAKRAVETCWAHISTVVLSSGRVSPMERERLLSARRTTLCQRWIRSPSPRLWSSCGTSCRRSRAPTCATCHCRPAQPTGRPSCRHRRGPRTPSTR